MSQQSTFARIQELEGRLSRSHVQAIRARSTDEANYLANLEDEYRASNEAIAQLQQRR